MKINVFVCCISLSTAALAQSSKDVNVVNTPSVTVEGTVPVSVSNTSAIPVNVGNTSAIPVNVGNTAPIVVRDADQSARQLYQFSTGGIIPAGVANDCIVTFTVPADKTLVVQYVTVSGTGHQGDDMRLSLSITNGGNSQYANHVVDFHWLSATSAFFVGSQQMTAYGAPGSIACFGLQRDSGSTAVLAEFTLAGYLIPAP
jgi:hypothetical protein